MSASPRADESKRASRITVSSPGSTPDRRPSGDLRSPSPPSTSSNCRTCTGSPSVEIIKPSSAFTVRGELKHSTDLIIAEVIVDTKLYPDGYDVVITSTVREDKFISLAPTPSSSQMHTPPSPPQNANTASLPILASIYTVPASPLYSSGLNADRPSRHLLRLLLPRAQYQISTVRDPLTGETRGALPKPQWYLDLQDKGFVVQISIQPLDCANKNDNKGTTNSDNGAKKVGGDRPVIARVDGVSVGVASEKASLTALGRDELQDDRVSRMFLLQRSDDDEGVFPDELTRPLGRADYVIDDAAIVPSADESHNSQPQEESSPQQEAADKSPVESSENGGLVQTPTSSAAPGGLLGFLNSYPSPFTRWPSSTKSNSQIQPPSLASSHRSSGVFPVVPGDLGEDETRKPESASTVTVPTIMLTSPLPRMFTLSILLVVALIAFLIGSLLRSLLSPADFIYVMTDIKDAEDISVGWREIRRLVEVKYIVGGWDFQIAVVRRH